MSGKRLGALCLAAGGLASAGLMAMPRPALAATWTVDQTADLSVAHCPSLVPSTPTCTLREAVKDSSASDTITVGSGTYHLSIAAVAPDDNTTGDLNITHPLTLRGSGSGTTTVVADGTLKDRLIRASGAGTLAITGLTLSNGTAGADSTNDGGCTVSGTFCSGGALDSTMKVALSDVVVDHNSATGNGGGVNIAVDGGGSTFNGVRFTHNQSNGASRVDVGGGGIYDELDNTAACGGGGAVATDSYTDVSFSNNMAVMNGGGAYFESNCNDGGGSILNRVDFDNNGGLNGGGAAYSANSGGTSISNATITANGATVGGSALEAGVPAGFGGGFELNNATINFNHGNGAAIFTNGTLGQDVIAMANTILYANTGPGGGTPHECDFTSGPTVNFTAWVLTDVTAAECRLSAAATDHNQPNGPDPLLSPLGNNGGFVATEALQAGSPAVDSGNPATPDSNGNYLLNVTVPPHCMPTDARGVARPVGAACDKGAYEGFVAATPSPSPIPVPSVGAVSAPQQLVWGWLLLVLPLAAIGVGVGVTRRRRGGLPPV